MNSNNKIKVFISSRCGGEYNNFNKFTSNEIIISEKVTNEILKTNYDIVRRALKKALEETNIIQAYVFENGTSSSQEAQDDFIYELDDSDICLFLIDNFSSDLSEGVLKEIDRAKNTNKKAIYLFWNDPKRDITQIQKENTGPSGLHYTQPFYDVRDFIDKGYQSIINDIIKVYQKWCKGYLISNKIEDQTRLLSEGIGDIEKSFSSIINIPKDSVHKNLSLTVNKLNRVNPHSSYSEVETSPLDKITLSVLNLILGEAKFNDIHLDCLIKELKKIQNNDLHQFVVKRWNAISEFYKGEIDNAIDNLMEVHNEYKSSDFLPDWLITDLLIDIRYFVFVKEQSPSDQFFFIQKEIEKTNSFYHYPLLDKFSDNIFNDLWQKNFNISTSSLFSKYFSSNEETFENIVNYLFTAIYYGSYTEINNTLEKYRIVLLDNVQKENNLLDKIQLLKVSILADDEDKFIKVMEAYKSSLSHATPDEILSLYRLADTKILNNRKRYWKVIIFREIGYYLCDDDYDDISNEILSFTEEWFNDDNLNMQLGNAIFKAIKHNVDRLSPTLIINLALEIFQRKCVRFYLGLFDMLNFTDVATFPDKLVNKLLNEIKDSLDDDQISKENIGLEKFLLKIRKNDKDNSELVDELVRKHFPNFFDKVYSLEVMSDNRISFIENYINDIHTRNKTQGINGKFTIYGDEPFSTIKNIIDADQHDLDEKTFLDLIYTIKETLVLNSQTYAEKISAIQLLMFLRNLTLQFEYNWEETLTELKKEYKQILQAQNHLFFKHTMQTLNFYWIVFKISCGEQCVKELLESLSILNNQDDYEKLQSLFALINLFRGVKKDLNRLKELPILVQHIFGFCFSPNFEIRYHTVKALYLLIDTEYSSIVVDQIAKMMDDDDARVKRAILNRVSEIERYNKLTFNYILSKAKIDTNYLIRKKAENYKLV